jgi:hypothetical protein
VLRLAQSAGDRESRVVGEPEIKRCAIAIINAQSYLDIDLADRSSRGCAWHFQGGYYVINIIRYHSLSDARADFANGCSGPDRTGSPGVHACVSDSDRGAGIGRFRYSHSCGGDEGTRARPRRWRVRPAADAAQL